MYRHFVESNRWSSSSGFIQTIFPGLWPFHSFPTPMPDRNQFCFSILLLFRSLDRPVVSSCVASIVIFFGNYKHCWYSYFQLEQCIDWCERWYLRRAMAISVWVNAFRWSEFRSMRRALCDEYPVTLNGLRPQFFCLVFFIFFFWILANRWVEWE